MYPIQNAGGHVGLSAREYPIDAGTAIVVGQVVKLSGGLVVSAIAGETGPILGIAAENHSAQADALNERSTGLSIKVYDNPELIFECKAPEFTANGGTETTVTAGASDVACATADAFNGGYLQLLRKGESSGNSDGEGQLIRVTDYAQAESVSTFTRESGGTAASGDVFRVYPPVGAVNVCALDSGTRTHFVLTGAGCSKIKVIGHDYERGMLRLMAVEHTLGVEN